VATRVTALLRRRRTPSYAGGPELERPGHGLGAEDGAMAIDMRQDMRQVMEEAREAMSGRRVYSEPYQRDGVTVILAARVQGGGGGGFGEGEPADGRGKGTGWGGGFGINARPVGAYVIRGDDVRFVPALDVTRMVIGAQGVAIAALLTLRLIVRKRAKRRS
jgi:uncharacterized spore protein YtfJ